MKLEEAAAILGVSLEDITIDGLKQTYKKLAMAWDPEKVGFAFSNVEVVSLLILSSNFLYSAKINRPNRSIC